MATPSDCSPPPDLPSTSHSDAPSTTNDKPKRSRQEQDAARVDKWKHNLNGKAVALPIDGKVVRAICRHYKFHYRPVPGYEQVSDLMAGYMVFMNDEERDAWRLHGWQMRYTGPACQASHHIWAKEFRDLPRLYLTSLRLLFPRNAVRSRERVKWGKENFTDMMFVNFDQFDLVANLRLRHMRECKSNLKEKMEEAIERTSKQIARMESTQAIQVTQATQTAHTQTTQATQTTPSGHSTPISQSPQPTRASQSTQTDQSSNTISSLYESGRLPGDRGEDL